MEKTWRQASACLCGTENLTLTTEQPVVAPLFKIGLYCVALVPGTCYLDQAGWSQTPQGGAALKACITRPGYILQKNNAF